MSKDRRLLKEIGYDENLLNSMTNEDCEAEVIEIQTGGHE